MIFTSKILIASLLTTVIYAKSNIEILGDYIQILLPAYGVYLGVKNEDNEGLKQFAKSTSSTLATTYALKYSVDRQRPDGSNNMSFPSGHTAFAFSGAFFIAQRYANTDNSIIAYSLASFVGYSRVYARKHYISDVIAGALISYGFNKYFISDIAFRTSINQDKKAIYLSWRQ